MKGLRVLLLLYLLLQTIAPTAAQTHATSTPARVVERVKASVVAVGTFQRTRNPQFRFMGTGFAVGDGSLIATNAHVVSRPLSAGAEPEVLAIQIPVSTRVQAEQAGQVREVLRVSFDPERDLALLRLQQGRLPALTLSKIGQAAEGDSLLFTGFPIGSVLGAFPATHRAMVAAVVPLAMPQPSSRELDPKLIRRLQKESFAVYQLDGTAYPGNSGSPLYDPYHGEVVGIVNMVFVRDFKEGAISQPSGISYAIPVEHLQRLLAAVQQ